MSAIGSFAWAAAMVFSVDVALESMAFAAARAFAMAESMAGLSPSPPLKFPFSNDAQTPPLQLAPNALTFRSAAR